MFGDFVSHRTLYCMPPYTLLPATSMPNFGAMLADINTGGLLESCVMWR